MTENEKIEALKSMGNANETDVVLGIYLKIAAQSILNRRFPFSPTITVVPDEYATKQLEIAAYLLSKRGAEGQTAHKENGIDRTYESASIPESMVSDITPFLGVIK